MFEQRDFFDSFVLREVGGQRGNLPLEKIDDAWMFAEFRMRGVVDTLQLHISIDTLPIRHDQRRGELALVPDQHNLIYESRAFDKLLDRLRRNVFAARCFEQLLLAIGYT